MVDDENQTLAKRQNRFGNTLFENIWKMIGLAVKFAVGLVSVDACRWFGKWWYLVKMKFKLETSGQSLATFNGGLESYLVMLWIWKRPDRLREFEFWFFERGWWSVFVWHTTWSDDVGFWNLNFECQNEIFCSQQKFEIVSVVMMIRVRLTPNTKWWHLFCFWNLKTLLEISYAAWTKAQNL